MRRISFLLLLLIFCVGSQDLISGQCLLPFICPLPSNDTDGTTNNNPTDNTNVPSTITSSSSQGTLVAWIILIPIVTTGLTLIMIGLCLCREKRLRMTFPVSGMEASLPAVHASLVRIIQDDNSRDPWTNLNLELKEIVFIRALFEFLSLYRYLHHLTTPPLTPPLSSALARLREEAALLSKEYTSVDSIQSYLLIHSQKPNSFIKTFIDRSNVDPSQLEQGLPRDKTQSFAIEIHRLIYGE